MRVASVSTPWKINLLDIILYLTDHQIWLTVLEHNSGSFSLTLSSGCVPMKKSNRESVTEGSGPPIAE